MRVKVRIPPYLKHLAGENEFLTVEGSTVGDCLEGLIKEYPELDEWLFTKERKLSNSVEVYLNKETVAPEKLAMPVNDGDEIILAMIITGG